MSEISGQRAAEWPSLRLGLAGAVALVLLVLAGWAREEAFIDEPTRLEQTERCLKREKLLQVGPVEHDPIAARASGGALATRVEGNGVRILIAGSRQEAARLATAYQLVGGELRGRLDQRFANVHLWEMPSSPTQRQTLYDCVY